MATNKKDACARQIFDKACAVKEHWACGMVGRVMIESGTSPDFTEGRRYLQTTCEKVGGFACRMLAVYLEEGKLGDYEQSSIAVLLARACSGGDADACGNHATAAETMQR